jgi:hypothetical protein
LKFSNVFPNFLDDAGYFMPWHNWVPSKRELPEREHQIAVTHSARMDADKHLAASWPSTIALLKTDIAVGAVENRCFHELSSGELLISSGNQD